MPNIKGSNIHYKTFGSQKDSSTVSVDDTSRVVTNVFSTIGVVDSDNDVIAPGAFDKTLAERGPNGKGMILHLANHNPDVSKQVGKIISLEVSGSQLIAKSQIPNTTYGNDMLELYKNGMINQHSIGFAVVQSEMVGNQGEVGSYCLIKEVKLYEGSSVCWGANEYTPNISVGKSLEEKITMKDSILKEIEKICTIFKDGKVSDETCSLLEYRMKQLQTNLSELFKTEESTQPVIETVEPVVENETGEEDELTQKLLLLKIKYL